MDYFDLHYMIEKQQKEIDELNKRLISVEAMLALIIPRPRKKRGDENVRWALFNIYEKRMDEISELYFGLNPKLFKNNINDNIQSSIVKFTYSIHQYFSKARQDTDDGKLFWNENVIKKNIYSMIYIFIRRILEKSTLMIGFKNNNLDLIGTVNMTEE